MQIYFVRRQHDNVIVDDRQNHTSKMLEIALDDLDVISFCELRAMFDMRRHAEIGL